MALKIIIDGYNLLMTSDRFRRDFINFPEETREEFIKSLSGYKRLKGHDITVVFDGWKSGYPIENRDVISGIKVVYSRMGEKADLVIKRMVERGDGSTIVTSDREVAIFASRHGAVVISSGEFGESLMLAASETSKADEISMMKDETDEDNFEKSLTTKKKGNPRRLSRIQRKKVQRLKKL